MTASGEKTGTYHGAKGKRDMTPEEKALAAKRASEAAAPPVVPSPPEDEAPCGT